MHNQLTALVALVLTLVVTVAGCTHTQTAIEGEPIGDAMPESSRRPTISLERGGGAAGVAGVNRYSTLVEPEFFAGGAYRFREMATSRMAGPPEAMAFEQRFLSTLKQVRSYSIDPGVFALLDGDGRELLRFTPAE